MPGSSDGSDRSGEALDARKGGFRILSAGDLEQGAYSFRSSLQFSSTSNALKDGRSNEVMSATIAAGYDILPFLHLAAHGGPAYATQTLGGFVQNFTFARFGAAVTGMDDIGERILGRSGFWFGGASLSVDFSKITRFFKGLAVHPQLITSFDFTETYQIPLLVHGNLGFRTKDSGRFFDSSRDISDFDRFATRSLNANAITAGLGFEAPLGFVRPVLEFNLEYVSKVGLSRSPKWLTVGAKSRPLPHKNIEVFAATDLNLSSFRATPADEIPVVYRVPTWNLILGFGLSQFGKREGEINVDAQTYRLLQENLDSREKTLAQLRRDLSYNTIQGQVLNAETKRPMQNVVVSFPDLDSIQPSQTDSNGEFLRYFPRFSGRIQFSASGFETATQFYNLQPGEAITANVELRPATAVNQGDLVVTITNEAGEALEAQVLIRELNRGEETRLTTDRTGRVSVKLAQGDYRITITASGYQRLQDRFRLDAGRAVLRTYSLQTIE